MQPLELGLQLVHPGIRVILERELQAVCGFAHQSVMLAGRAVGGIPDKRDARCARQRFPEELEALRHRFGGKPGNAGQVGFRPCEIAHQLRATCISHPDEDDRDVARSVGRRARPGRGSRDDYLDLLAHKLLRERGSLSPALRRAVLDAQVLALDVAEAAQLGEERGALGRRRFGERRQQQVADAVRLRRLRPGCERSRERRRPNARREITGSPHPPRAADAPAP